jgi:hypothetical protein
MAHERVHNKHHTIPTTNDCLLSSFYLYKTRFTTHSTPQDTPQTIQDTPHNLFISGLEHTTQHTTHNTAPHHTTCSLVALKPLRMESMCCSWSPSKIETCLSSCSTLQDRGSGQRTFAQIHIWCMCTGACARVCAC